MLSNLIHAATQVANHIFWYCTDFMINLANLTQTSYVEANTWVLLLFIPGVVTLLVAARILQEEAIRRVQRQLRVSHGLSMGR